MLKFNMPDSTPLHIYWQGTVVLKCWPIPPKSANLVAFNVYGHFEVAGPIAAINVIAQMVKHVINYEDENGFYQRKFFDVQPNLISWKNTSHIPNKNTAALPCELSDAPQDWISLKNISRIPSMRMASPRCGFSDV